MTFSGAYNHVGLTIAFGLPKDYRGLRELPYLGMPNLIKKSHLMRQKLQACPTYVPRPLAVDLPMDLDRFIV